MVLAPVPDAATLGDPVLRGRRGGDPGPGDGRARHLRPLLPAAALRGDAHPQSGPCLLDLPVHRRHAGRRGCERAPRGCRPCAANGLSRSSPLAVVALAAWYDRSREQNVDPGFWLWTTRDPRDHGVVLFIAACPRHCRIVPPGSASIHGPLVALVALTFLLPNGIDIVEPLQAGRPASRRAGDVGERSLDAGHHRGVAPPGRSWRRRGVPAAAAGNRAALPLHRLWRDVPPGHGPARPIRTAGSSRRWSRSCRTRGRCDSGWRPPRATTRCSRWSTRNSWRRSTAGPGLSLCEPGPYRRQFTPARSAQRPLHRGRPEHPGETARSPAAGGNPDRGLSG